MRREEEDLALQTLLAIRSASVSELDEALLRECYAIQRRYQFDPDPSQALAAMERLIDEAVTALGSESSQ